MRTPKPKFSIEYVKTLINHLNHVPRKEIISNGSHLRMYLKEIIRTCKNMLDLIDHNDGNTNEKS